MKADAGWAMGCAVLALGFLGVFTEPLLADPATSVANESCTAQCQTVLGDCKQLCEEVGSGEMRDYKGAVGQQTGACADKCAADFQLCRKDC